MLHDGIMGPYVKTLSAVKQYFPDSNTRIGQIAAYFIAAFLEVQDERLKDSRLVELLEKQAKEDYDRLNTPKEHRHSWAHHLFERITGASMADKIPTHFNATVCAYLP